MLALNVSQAGAFGAAADAPHAVSGIATGDILLACWAWEPGNDPVGVSVSEGTVGNGTVTLSDAELADHMVWFVWYTPKE